MSIWRTRRSYASSLVEDEQRLNPAWHIHAGRLPNHGGSPVSFGMLLNLASVVECRNPRHPVGVHPALNPGRDAREHAVSR